MATHAVLPDELDALREHVDECPDCGAALLALIRASAPAQAATSADMPAGTRIGRFTLHDVLGSGNMGTVFTAWDPQLDRMVAIKVLRAGRDDAHHAARLLREAKAMAQVRHPNVVTVYEVGQDQDVIFVAMELVRGPTLRAKLAEVDPPVAVRLDWLAQIGRALDAIHDAGLIHRDLKPDNVFLEDVARPDHVGSPHRVVIGDFGLAAAHPREPEGAAPSGLATGTRSAGTPAYAAPEQLRGDPLDARADLFAFGVTAWEVLTGTRPFEGRTAAELEASIRRGPPRSPALEVLPRAVADVLVRCVAHDREQRPRAIAEVLRPLEAEPRRRGGRALGPVLAVAALAVVAVVAGLAVRRNHDAAAPVCDPRAPARWNGMRAAWLARAALSPYVRDAIVATMDRRALAWPQAAAAACSRDGVAQLAWRLCRPKLEALEQRVLEVAVERSWPDDQPVIRSLERVPPPSYCGSSEAAEEAVALSSLPSDAARAAVTDGLGWLARAYALDDLGAAATRDEALATTAKIAATIAPSPLDGELALARALLQPPAAPGEEVAALKAAVATAERSGRASLIARAWMALADRASQLEIPDATIEAALTQADWSISRLGDPPRLRVRWLVVDGSHAWTRGDHVAAKARLAAATKLAGDDRELARLSQLAIAKLAAVSGDDHKAVEVYRELLADPKLVRADPEQQIGLESVLAEALYRLGQLADAQRTIDHALELGRTALAPNHPAQIENQIIAASIVLERGDGSAALALLDTATAQARRSFGADHVMVAAALLRTAQVLMYSGRVDDGMIAARDAVRIFDLRQGRRSEGSIAARYLIAEAYRTRGKLDVAAPLYAELLADAEALYGTAHPMWAQLTEGEADVLIALGRGDEARALLERAIPVLAKGASPDTTAFAKFTLAKLVEPRDHAYAISLATEAEAALRGDPAWSEDRANVAAWLRRHPPR